MHEAALSPTRVLKSLALGSLIVFGSTNCTTNAYTGQQQVSKTAIGSGVGAAGGAILGAIIGNNTGDSDGGRGALIGAGVGALLGGGIGAYMDKQEAAIRYQLEGSGVSVTRDGNNIVLNMPQDITFSSGSNALRQEFTNTLDSVALVLAKYEQTQLGVNGHTDSDGSHSYNQSLSQARALAVANYLAGNGVASTRLRAYGYGETQPIASNNTSEGKAQNRRVEIHIVPQQQQQ